MYFLVFKNKSINIIHLDGSHVLVYKFICSVAARTYNNNNIERSHVYVDSPRSWHAGRDVRSLQHLCLHHVSLLLICMTAWRQTTRPPHLSPRTWLAAASIPPAFISPLGFGPLASLWRLLYRQERKNHRHVL